MALLGRSYTRPIVLRGADDAAPPPDVSGPLSPVYSVVVPPPLPPRGQVIMRAGDPTSAPAPTFDATPPPTMVAAQPQPPKRAFLMLAAASAEIWISGPLVNLTQPKPWQGQIITRSTAPDDVVVPTTTTASVVLVAPLRPALGFSQTIVRRQLEDGTTPDLSGPVPPSQVVSYSRARASTPPLVVAAPPDQAPAVVEQRPGALVTYSRTPVRPGRVTIVRAPAPAVPPPPIPTICQPEGLVLDPTTASSLTLDATATQGLTLGSNSTDVTLGSNSTDVAINPTSPTNLSIGTC